MPETAELRVNGRACEARPGVTVAAAIAHAGESATRTSVRGEARGPVCGMGVCFECRVTADGQEHERACVRRIAPGMDVWTAHQAERRVGARSIHSTPVYDAPAGRRECDVLVIGAGPAGLAAAWSAATGRERRRVLLLDDNEMPGGQIWRGDQGRRSSAWRDKVAAAGVEVLSSTAVVQRIDDRELAAFSGRGPLRIGFRAAVIATGATELFLPFPGWTLPNVTGVGGLQALVKGGLEIRGKRIVIAGSGPLLLAVGASLRERGAHIAVIAEQADASRVWSLAGAMGDFPLKLLQGAGLKWRLRGVPQWNAAWPVRAIGDDRVHDVDIVHDGSVRRVGCDYLACGFGLVPRGRVAALLGCSMDGFAVRADGLCRTSVEGVFAAGECTGAGGVDKGIAEGLVAGAMAGGDHGRAVELASKLPAERGFSRMLAETYELRPELKALVDPGTVVCRCEDVAFGEAAQAQSWREAKLHTRCGMGPCQGCMCGPAMSFIRGWPVGDARPPVLSVPLGALV